jgi:deazaflavin-dependent oxidoreductase (nitroreductase family)
MADTPQKPPPAWLMKAFIGLHVALYRLSGGKVGAHMGRGAVALITAPGRKSGKRITLPLIYVKTDRGFAVIASRGGAPTHPAWYLNLRAAGRAEFTLGRRTVPVRVEEPPIDGERYRAIWRDAVAAYPDYDVYQARTSRRIPVVELVPAPN